jgi:signal transduction histidine kinase
LLDFVEQYRKLTKLPNPEFEEIQVEQLLQDIVVLFRGSETSGEPAVVCSSELRIRADRKLIEQVLINLVKNATESLSGTENPLIELKAFHTARGRVCIQVKDNGPGIPGDVLPNIFVPFYSTRENGSGIGLSISRQIMDLHQGKITVHSVPAKETIFSLVF